MEKDAPISLMSLPSMASRSVKEFFHDDFRSSAGLGRGCNPARGCSRRGTNVLTVQTCSRRGVGLLASKPRKPIKRYASGKFLRLAIEAVLTGGSWHGN